MTANISTKTLYIKHYKQIEGNGRLVQWQMNRVYQTDNVRPIFFYKIVSGSIRGLGSRLFALPSPSPEPSSIDGFSTCYLISALVLRPCLKGGHTSAGSSLSIPSLVLFNQQVTISNQLILGDVIITAFRRLTFAVQTFLAKTRLPRVPARGWVCS